MQDAQIWLSIYPPLAPHVYLRRRPERLPFPLDQQGCRVFAQARQGLWHALAAVGLREGDEVLAPAYHHGCEIETLARRGLRCRFYDVGDTVEPRGAELDALIGARTRALHLIHHLGFPQDARWWRRWCDERDLLLIEDGAQAWMSVGDGGPIGAHGDIAIFCLYKAVGVPDGGAVVCRGALASPSDVSPVGVRGVVHRHVDWLAQRWPAAGRRREGLAVAHRAEERPETHFAISRTQQPALRATHALLSRAVGRNAPQRRRINFATLAARLGDLRSQSFPLLSESASPLAFPVEVDRKPVFVERLAQQGIVDGKLWCVPHPSLDVTAYPGAAALRDRLVGLPVHQELRRRDLDRIVSAALRAAEG